MIVLILIFLLLIVGFGYWGHDRECGCGGVTGGLAVFGDVPMEGSPVVEDLASEGTNEFFGFRIRRGPPSLCRCIGAECRRERRRA